MHSEAELGNNRRRTLVEKQTLVICLPTAVCLSFVSDSTSTYMASVAYLSLFGLCLNLKHRAMLAEAEMGNEWHHTLWKNRSS